MSTDIIHDGISDDVDAKLQTERIRIEQQRNLRHEARILDFEDELEKQPVLWRNVTLFEMGIQNEFACCDTIHGVVTQADPKENSYVFTETFGTSLTEKHTCLNLLSTKMGLLLQYFCEQKLILVLKGCMCENQRKTTFYVQSIHTTGIPQDGGPSHTVDDVVLQGIVARLVAEEVPDCLDQEAFRNCQLPTNKEELGLLYALLKGELTSGQRTWVEFSLRQVGMNELSKDERKHTMRAISYLLNVDWLPRQTRLPPVQELREQLDRTIFGMEPVKKRILEIAAQIRRSGEIPKWGVLLEGPPGVGKTTVAKAVAAMLGLPFVSLDLSTIRDPESLGGSSRRYSNARPGMILEKIFENRSGSGVFVLNELDKAFTAKSTGGCGDALLSLVDKQGFQDDFMEVLVYPQFFFLATCNDAQAISKPLLDRFIRISIERYTVAEKCSIFREKVFPKALAAAGVSGQELTVTTEFVERLCREYASEAGIRDLEQAAQRVVGDYLLRTEQEGLAGRQYTKQDLEELFGKKEGVIECTLRMTPGQVKTMFCDGEVRQLVMVQATKRSGTGQFNMIGVPTEFYRDCCRVAFECVKNICVGMDFRGLDVTVYIPDQLSASYRNCLGCAVFMAIMSALTGKVVPETSVFLGGCDLMGNVFFDEPTIDPVIEYLEQMNCDTCLYGPMNLGQLVTRAHGIKIVGAVDIAVLCEVAM